MGFDFNTNNISPVSTSGGTGIINSLNVTPTTSAQTFNASNVDGYKPVTVSAVTSAIDNNIVAGNIKDGVTILGVTGEYVGTSPVIDSLSITPTTSAQTITAPSGIDGYSPINVSAVTSSIDANITAQNIVSGVSILGVSGSATVLNGDTLSVTPTTSAQTLTPTSPKNGFTEVSVSAVTSAIDNNIAPQNIRSGVSILGVNGLANIVNGTTLDVTPTTSAQTINPTSPKNCFTKVKVAAVTSSIDSNLVAGNIRAGVTILGITGTYTGGASTITLTVSIPHMEISGLNTFTIDGNSYTQSDFTFNQPNFEDELTLQLYADTNYDWSVTAEPSWTVISSASGRINSSVDTALELSFESDGPDTDE